jgi:hypothetical protein
MTATTTRPLGTLSESMFGTTDLDGAVAHWTSTLGFELAHDERPAWAMLADPTTKQRFVLMGQDEGFEPCLGIESADFDASLRHLVEHGGTVDKRTPVGEAGFQWACCTDAFGIELMVWHTPSE